MGRGRGGIQAEFSFVSIPIRNVYQNKIQFGFRTIFCCHEMERRIGLKEAAIELFSVHPKLF